MSATANAALRGIFVAVVVGGATFCTLGILLAYGCNSWWPSFALSPLLGLPGGLFAFLWALRPEAPERDRHGTP